MAPKKGKGKGKKKGKQQQQRKKKKAPPGDEPSGSHPGAPPPPRAVPVPPELEPEPGDRGKLVGLRTRPDLDRGDLNRPDLNRTNLNGRRVEVEGRMAQDLRGRAVLTGTEQRPGTEEDRFAVRLLFGDGAGSKIVVKRQNLELDYRSDPALDTLLEAMRALAPGGPPEEWRDWAGGLPDEVLEKVAGKVVSQTEAGWAAQLKGQGFLEEYIREKMAKRKREGNCLFVFALVCKRWRKAQLKVGGPLRTRVRSDVIPPGRVALVKWALAEGCPREDEIGNTMANIAAKHGHLELVQWLCGEGGLAMIELVMNAAAGSGNLELVKWLIREQSFAMDKRVMQSAACSGNLELVRWLRAEGCPWDDCTCHQAVKKGHVEMLRWVRANGCPWYAVDRDLAEWKLGYTDDLGNTL